MKILSEVIQSDSGAPSGCTGVARRRWPEREGEDWNAPEEREAGAPLLLSVEALL